MERLFTLEELEKRDLAMYIGGHGCIRRGHTNFAIVKVLKRNGKPDYRIWCSNCQRPALPAIAYAKLSDHEKMTARIVRNNLNSGVDKCEHCGNDENGIEWHHWAPKAIFDDYETWPLAILCSKCHREWHKKIREYYQCAVPTARSARNARSSI